jgi:asparagine N-glycosylation enzyme membrane subunit Stt3
MQTEESISTTQYEERRAALSRLVTLKPVQIIAGFAVVAAVMGWIEWGGPAILDNDGYYHIRWSKMLRESFPHLPPFKALPLTILNEQDYVDHHYLFHLLLTPFTLGDLRVGAKLAAVVFSSLGILSLFALLVAYDVRWRWLWLAPLIASSEPFLYRMSMTRAPALSLALLGLGTYLILKRKHILLSLLSFAFVWYYSLFPLILAFAIAYAIAVYLAERRIDLWAALACASGIIAGLLINPYFPKNLTLLYQHILMKLNTTSGYTVDVGVEWYPYETWVMLASSAVACVIYFAGLLAFDFRSRVRDLNPLFFLIVSAMLLVMALKSRRFIEYWPPFAVIFAAFTFNRKFEQIDTAWLAQTRDRIITAIAAAVVTVAALGAMVGTVFQAHADVESEADPFAYRGASEWIAEHTPPGSLIFNTDWDDFPMLFYYNPGNTYIVGLDPTYLYDRDKSLWNLYARITLGEEEDPGPLIRERFGAEYVFTDNGHTDFLNNAYESGDFETVYKDSHTTVLRLLTAGEPKTKQQQEDRDGEQ